MATTDHAPRPLDELYVFFNSPMPSKMWNDIVQPLLPLHPDGSPTKLGMRVYKALRAFHEDRNFHHQGCLDLSDRTDSKHVDEVFQEFLRTNWEDLFVASSISLPTYEDTMDASK